MVDLFLDYIWYELFHCSNLSECKRTLSVPTAFNRVLIRRVPRPRYTKAQLFTIIREREDSISVIHEDTMCTLPDSIIVSM
jgi:hypothetical protein